MGTQAQVINSKIKPLWVIHLLGDLQNLLYNFIMQQDFISFKLAYFEVA